MHPCDARVFLLTTISVMPALLPVDVSSSSNENTHVFGMCAEGGVPTVHAGGGPNHHHIITIERRRDYNTKSPYGWAREGWASL